MRKFVSMLLCSLVLSVSTVYAIPSGVITTTASIGGARANLVYIDMTVENRTGEAVVSPQLAPVSASGLINSVNDGNVVAAMNGGFFNAYYKAATVSYPDNYPKIYGTVISEGEVLNGGGTGPGLVFEPNGTPHIGNISISTYYVVNGQAFDLRSINYENASCYTDAMKAPVYVPAGTAVTYVKNGVVTGTVESQGVNIEIPEDTVVFLGNKSLKAGDSVKIKYTASVDGESVDAYTAITCGPRILQNGVNVASSANSSSYDSKQSADSVAQRSFAAIAPDGRLILGTSVTSPNSIATYLQSIGVKDALLFDGGASSMLYVKDKGFTTSAGRNLASIFTIVDLYTAPDEHNAVPSQASVTVNSSPVNINAYTINYNNYYRIRDIAYILKNTSAAFDVGWDNQTGTITITSVPEGTYTGDMPLTGIQFPSDAVKSSASIVVNGQAVTPEIYNIDGNTFFKLRDIVEYLGADVSWDSDASVINITA